MDRLGITFKGSFGELSAIRLSDNDEIHNGGSIAGDGWRFGGRRLLAAQRRLDRRPSLSYVCQGRGCFSDAQRSRSEFRERAAGRLFPVAF